MKKHLLSFFSFIISLTLHSQTIEELQMIIPDSITSASDFFMGASMDIDGNYAVIGESGYNGGTGRAYVLYFDGSKWNKIARLTSSDGSTNDYFGSSVAIDGNTIVVGVPGDDIAGTYSGSAYVFVKPDTGWKDMTETAKLTSDDVASYDNFGISVGISGNTIVIGANNHDSNKGAVYVYVKPDNGWVTMTQTGRLLASDAADNDYLGRSVSISGNTIVAGASGSDTNGNGAGCAYVFVKPDTGWGNAYESAKLLSSAAIEKLSLGYSVSIENNTIIAGAAGYDNYKGAAFVYEKPGAGWSGTVTEKAILTAYNGMKYDFAGRSVDISGDVVVIGTDYSGGIKPAYVFVKPQTGWANATETAKLTPENGKVTKFFSRSVCATEDLIFCGSSYNDTLDISSGAVYVFNKPEAGWFDKSEDEIITGDFGILSNLYFGTSIAISGNYAVVGQPNSSRLYYTWKIDKSGMAYIYEFDGNKWNKIATLTSSDALNSDYFGVSVDIDNDVVIIGAWGYEGRKSAAFIFEKPTGGWTDMTETAKLTASDRAVDDFFGSSVAVSGNVAVVGAHRDDDKGTDSGSAYVFEKPESGWADMTETVKINASDEAGNDYFGYSVAIEGNTVAIGASQNHGRIGAVYVFEKPDEGWSNLVEKAKLTPSDATYNNYLGSCLDISGNVIAAGALISRTSVYIYEKPDEGWTNGTQTAKLVAPNSNLGPTSVSIDDNIVVVGCTYDSNLTGAAYLFQKNGTQWTDMATETLNIAASDGKSTDKFGVSVAVSNNNILIGANETDDYTSDNGKVYFYKYQTPTYINDRVNNGDILIYPNPASNTIRINSGFTSADIFNITGQKIMTISYPGRSKEINISDLPAGSYLLRVKTNDNRYKVLKFIKR